MRSTSITLLNSKNLKDLLGQVSEPFPQPSADRLVQLAGLIEQVNIKAESLELSFFSVAAEYFVRTCVGHKLIDGNKRAAVVLLEGFYQLNNKNITFANEKVAAYAVMMSSIKTSQISVRDKVLFFENELKANR